MARLQLSSVSSAMMFVAPSIFLVIASMAPGVQSREPQLSDMSQVAPMEDTATASLANILASTQDALERYQNQASRYNTPYYSHRRTAGSGSGSGSGTTSAPTAQPGSGSGSGSGSGTGSPTSYAPTSEPTPLATTPPDTGNVPTDAPTPPPTAGPTFPDEVVTMIEQMISMKVPFESAQDMKNNHQYMTVLNLAYGKTLGLTEVINEILQFLYRCNVDADVEDTRRASVEVTYSTRVSSRSSANLAQAEAGVTDVAALKTNMVSVLTTLNATSAEYADMPALPVTSSINYGPVSVTTTTAAPASAASSGTDNTLYIIIGVVGGVLLIAGVIAAVFIFTRSAPEAEHSESPGGVGLTQELIPMTTMGTIDSETIELNGLDQQAENGYDRYAPA